MPLSLNLSALVDGQTADASDVITPFNQVQSFVNAQETALNSEVANRTTAISNLRTGVEAFTQLNVGVVGSTLGIVSGTITISQSRHIIDTEGLAATDDLVTIHGGTAGDLLILQIVSAARPVTLKHNAGGSKSLFNYTLADIVLDQPSKLAVYVFDADTDRWCLATAAQQSLLLREVLNTTPVATPVLTLPDRTLVSAGYGAPRIDVVPGITTSNRVTVRGSGATLQSDLATLTIAGTPTAANQTDSSYTLLTSAATLAQAAGWVTTYDQLQRRYNPLMEISIRTPSTFPAARWFIGFMAGPPGNADDPGAGLIGLRYSTVAGDSGWKILLDDGTTMTVHGVDLAAYNADTPYLFRIRVDGSGGGMAYFSVNNGHEIAVNAGMIGASVNLGFGNLAYTNAAVAKTTLFRSAFITWA
jgi:hypothetical protein